ncbi:Zinc transporter 2 [Glycine soja]|nr:Zinc transporter 2 [Glycine soja]
MLVSTFAGGVSPYFFRWNDTFLVLGTQFADLTSKSYPFAFMLALSGYLLAMLGDCFVNFVTSNSQKKPKVVELEGGKASQEQHHQARDQCAVAETTNPVLLKTSSVGDTILLILTLCFQSLFEGIAVGVAAPLALPCIDATTQGSTADWMFAITMGVLIAINHLISKGFKQQGIG